MRARRSRRSTIGSASCSRAALPEGPTSALEVLEDARRAPRRVDRPDRPRYFAFVALVRARDRRRRRPARLLLRRQPRRLGGGGDRDRGPGSALGGGVPRLPAAAGAFTSGGTVSNMTALAAARERAIPGSRRRGLGRVPATLYCSDEAHYSIERAAEILGLGSENVRSLPIDGDRRLPPEAVAEAIRADRAAGCVPVAVVATAGTTLTGAVDPIDGLADVCAEEGVWLHVDGAYGLPAATAPSTAHLFAGLDRADSVTLDAHKWLFLPKACGVLLVRRREDLFDAFSHEESYIPHERSNEHMVDITLEYSRPFRALKLWLAFRAHGAQAFRDAVENNVRQAQLLYDLVVERDALEPLCGRPPLSIVPFRHVGRCRRPERAQRRPRADAAGRRPRLGRAGDGGRQDRAAAVLRQLPHDGRRRARARRRRRRARVAVVETRRAAPAGGRYPRTMPEPLPSAEYGPHVELRLQALLDAIPDLMFRISADGTYLDFAGDAELLANPREDVVGGTVDELLPPARGDRPDGHDPPCARDGDAADGRVRAADDAGRRARVRDARRADRREARSSRSSATRPNSARPSATSGSPTSGSCRRVMPSGDGWSGTSTTVRSSGWSSRCRRSGWRWRGCRSRRPAARPPAPRRAASSRSRSRRCARSRAGCIRPRSPRTASPRRRRRWQTASRGCFRSTSTSPVPASIPSSRPARTTSSPRRSRMRRSTRRPRGRRCGSSSRVDAIEIDVADDGCGGACATPGGGLEGLAERVSALGGVLAVVSPPGEGTRLHAELPVPLHVS